MHFRGLFVFPIVLSLFSLPSSADVLKVVVDDTIQAATAERVERAIDRASEQKYEAVLLEVDTPGGLMDSMENIMQKIIASPVPVIIYVTPSGSRAASAGFFILESADVAAMAPGTHTGAASPLLAVGGVPVSVDETLKKKILNDATAFLRSYSEKRGRNVTLAESAVTDGKAFSD